MAAYESQMAAQRSLMADAGLGINAAQPDALMHHQLAMAQNQNRKCLHQLSILSQWAPCLGGSSRFWQARSIRLQLKVSPINQIMILILQCSQNSSNL